MIGPGKFDNLALAALFASGGEAVMLIVIEKDGEAVSAKGKLAGFERLPKLLRHLAEKMEVDNKSIRAMRAKAN